MLLLPIVGTMTKIFKDKYSCGQVIHTDDLSGKVKYGYFSNISQIFKIFRYFNQIEIFCSKDRNFFLGKIRMKGIIYVVDPLR